MDIQNLRHVPVKKDQNHQESLTMPQEANIFVDNNLSWACGVVGTQNINFSSTLDISIKTKCDANSRNNSTFTQTLFYGRGNNNFLEVTNC